MTDLWEISPEATRAAIADAAPLVLLDCRTKAEYDVAHLDTAELLPLQQMSVSEAAIDAWRNKRVIVYCRTGRRSRIVARYMTLQGCTNVKSMAGGLMQWADDIDPAIEVA